MDKECKSTKYYITCVTIEYIANLIVVTFLLLACKPNTLFWCHKNVLGREIECDFRWYNFI